jgi:hypothetical protein
MDASKSNALQSFLRWITSVPPKSRIPRLPLRCTRKRSQHFAPHTRFAGLLLCLRDFRAFRALKSSGIEIDFSAICVDPVDKARSCSGRGLAVAFCASAI